MKRTSHVFELVGEMLDPTTAFLQSHDWEPNSIVSLSLSRVKVGRCAIICTNGGPSLISDTTKVKPSSSSYSFSSSRATPGWSSEKVVFSSSSSSLVRLRHARAPRSSGGAAFRGGSSSGLPPRLIRLRSSFASVGKRFSYAFIRFLSSMVYMAVWRCL